MLEKKFLKIMKVKDTELRKLALRGLYDVLLMDWLFNQNDVIMNDDKSFRFQVAQIWFDLYPDGSLN